MNRFAYFNKIRAFFWGVTVYISFQLVCLFGVIVLLASWRYQEPLADILLFKFDVDVFEIFNLIHKPIDWIFYSGALLVAGYMSRSRVH